MEALNRKLEEYKTRYKVKTQGVAGAQNPNLAQVLPKNVEKEYNPNARSIIYAFVTLKSMEHVKYLEHAYAYSWSKRFWIRLCCCCFRRENELLDSRLINGKWPEPKSATLPDNLIW